MPTCTRCGTDDPGVYLGLSKLECVNSACGAYVAPENPGGMPIGRVDSLTYWKPGDGDARLEPLYEDLKVNDDGSISIRLNKPLEYIAVDITVEATVGVAEAYNADIMKLLEETERALFSVEEPHGFSGLDTIIGPLTVRELPPTDKCIQIPEGFYDPKHPSNQKIDWEAHSKSLDDVFGEDPDIDALMKPIQTVHDTVSYSITEKQFQALKDGKVPGVSIQGHCNPCNEAGRSGPCSAFYNPKLGVPYKSEAYNTVEEIARLQEYAEGNKVGVDYTSLQVPQVALGVKSTPMSPEKSAQFKEQWEKAMKETSGAWKTPIFSLDDWEDVVPKAGWDDEPVVEVLSHSGTALVIPGTGVGLGEGEVLAEDATVEVPASWEGFTTPTGLDVIHSLVEREEQEKELELTIFKVPTLGATQYPRMVRVEQLPEALSCVTFTADDIKMWKTKDKED